MKERFCYNTLLIIALLFGCTERNTFETLRNEKQSYILKMENKEIYR